MNGGLPYFQRGIAKKTKTFKILVNILLQTRKVEILGKYTLQGVINTMYKYSHA